MHVVEDGWITYSRNNGKSLMNKNWVGNIEGERWVEDE